VRLKREGGVEGAVAGRLRLHRPVAAARECSSAEGTPAGGGHVGGRVAAMRHRRAVSRNCRDASRQPCPAPSRCLPLESRLRSQAWTLQYDPHSHCSSSLRFAQMPCVPSLSGRSAVDIASKEFLCPLCKRGSNIIVPQLRISSEEKQLAAAVLMTRLVGGRASSVLS